MKNIIHPGLWVMAFNRAANLHIKSDQSNSFMRNAKVHSKFPSSKVITGTQKLAEVTPQKSSFKNRMNGLRNKYYVEVYLTPSKIGEGPGHISCSLITQKNDKSHLVVHTSYMPMGLVCLLNGVTLGAFPVLSSNYEDIRPDDIAKSKQILRIPVSEEAFALGVQKAKEIKSGVEKGQFLYAVTGKLNILSLLLTTIYSGYLGSELSIQKFTQDKRVLPHEDHVGLVVTGIEDHPETFESARVYNCTEAVQEVLEAVGIDFHEKYTLPASLGVAVGEMSISEIVSQSLIHPPKDALESDGESHNDAHIPDM